MIVKRNIRPYVTYSLLLIFLLLLASRAAARDSQAEQVPYGWREVGAGSASGGGISDNTDSSLYASLAIGPLGYPVVAWTDYAGADPEIYVRGWDGASWAELGAGSASGGGISANDGLSWSPSLAVGADGHPVVAWHDDSGGDVEDIYVRRWDGAAWAEIGAGSAGGGGISDSDGYSSYPSLAIDLDGYPVVAWSNYVGDEFDGDYEIYLRRWDGAAWVEIGGSATGGGISANDGISEFPSLAIDPDGYPVVAWIDQSGGEEEIYARRWNGESWVQIGKGSATGGGISDNDGYSAFPSLALDPDGNPIVAWQDDSGGGSAIYVRRWDGKAWVEMGAGSASGGGISDSDGYAEAPSLAVGPDGFPIIAWADSGYQIYVRRWNGAAWGELGAGSASGGGISADDGSSQYPSLAIGADGLPVVAWDDTSGGDDEEIYVRGWDGYRLFLPGVLGDK